MITVCKNCTLLRDYQILVWFTAGVCPVLLREDCPYEVLARIFNTYFKDTSRINTSEDFLNFGWAAPLFSESDWSTMKHHAKKMALVSTALLSTLLTLKIAIFYNLIILKVCKYLSLFTLFYSLRVSRCPRSFWIPCSSH